MLKLLLLAAIGYIVYRYVWRDPSIDKAQPRKPLRDSPFSNDEIEDTEYTEKK